MPIVTSDILFKYSTPSGAAGNATAGAAGTSLGKYISTTVIADATANALFDDVTGDENVALDVEYRCVFIHNAHATLQLILPRLWVQSEVAGGTNVAIALDPTAPTVIGSAAVQSLTVGTENTAPPGPLSFSTPTDKATGLAVASIDPGKCVAFWIRRTATNSAALNNDGATFRVEGDTNA